MASARFLALLTELWWLLCVWRVDGVTTMNKGTFTLCAAAALGLAATLLMPTEVTAIGSGMHSFHSSPIKFFRPFRHHHHHLHGKNWNNWNNGLYAGYGYGYGGYYMPTYSGDYSSDDITGSAPVTTIIPPPPALKCEKSREVVTVPSAIDGTARQITVTRC